MGSRQFERHLRGSWPRSTRRETTRLSCSKRTRAFERGRSLTRRNLITRRGIYKTSYKETRLLPRARMNRMRNNDPRSRRNLIEFIQSRNKRRKRYDRWYNSRPKASFETRRKPETPPLVLAVSKGSITGRTAPPSDLSSTRRVVF